MLYMPVINLLSEWFVQRRGLAGGIIFAGSGVGGKSPVALDSVPSLTVATRVRISSHGKCSPRQSRIPMDPQSLGPWICHIGRIGYTWDQPPYSCTQIPTWTETS